MKTTITLLSAALLLSACASYQGIAPSGKRIDSVALPQTGNIDAAKDAWPQEDWWHAWGDAQLDRLMEHALVNSPTLALAQARIVRAQSAATFTRGNSGPQATFDTDVSYGRQSENFLVPKPPLGPGGTNIWQGRTAVDFSYDLDLWGKNAALIRAAEAQVDAGNYDRDAARLALTTAIARTYAQLAAQYELQDILQATQKQRGEIRKLTEMRLKSGLDTRVEQKQAEASEASLGADLAQIATSIDVTRLQLAALAGDMPDSAKNIARPALPALPFTVPRDLPLDLLARRPELAAQRARITGALGESEAAKAQFYPNINLSGFLGFQSIGLGNLLHAGSLVTGLGPAIHLPLFDNGRLRANYAGKIADVDAAVAQYNQSVVTAAQEVAEQLTRISSLAREEEATRAALAASEEAYRLAMLRYRGGLSPYLTALTAETQVLAQRRAAADLKARRQDLQIGLVRALGGGFREASEVHAAATQH
jgi:NodT family efflux transporter outer membrane factor (OMF) lipoprotein